VCNVFELVQQPIVLRSTINANLGVLNVELDIEIGPFRRSFCSNGAFSSARKEEEREKENTRVDLLFVKSFAVLFWVARNGTSQQIVHLFCECCNVHHRLSLKKLSKPKIKNKKKEREEEGEAG
jgi:hypothetical protein